MQPQFTGEMFGSGFVGLANQHNYDEEAETPVGEVTWQASICGVKNDEKKRGKIHPS